MMSSSDFDTYEFQRGLQLSIRQYGENAIEFELKNRLYYQQRHQKLKQLLALLGLFVLYCSMAWLTARSNVKLLRRNLIADAGFALYTLYLIFSTCNLIKRERLLYCTDFAIQMETERFLSRRCNIFIPTPNIHDVRINEVIENIEIHYILIVRTKEALFKEKPIIPLFNAQRSIPLECLELIYKRLNKILRR